MTEALHLLVLCGVFLVIRIVQKRPSVQKSKSAGLQSARLVQIKKSLVAPCHGTLLARVWHQVAGHRGIPSSLKKKVFSWFVFVQCDTVECSEKAEQEKFLGSAVRFFVMCLCLIHNLRHLEKF